MLEVLTSSLGSRVRPARRLADRLTFQNVPPKKNPVPGPKGLPLIGIGAEFARDPLSLLVRCAREYGDLVRLPVGFRTMYLVNRPEYLKEIFKTTPNVFDESNLRYRERSQPSFAETAVEASLPILQSAVEELGDDWASQGDTLGREVGDDISAMTLTILVRQMFGANLEGHEETITRSFRTLVDFFAYRALSIVRPPLSWPLRRHREYRRALKALDTRMQEPGLQARALRDEVIGSLVDAHGRTAVFLSWILHHLASHPDVQERARAEAQAVLGDRAPTYDELAQLTYLGAVIEESMRLTPAGWIVSRSTVGWQRFGDHDLPPGSMLLISPYLMHRHPRYWERPDAFDPDRFSPERADWAREMANECRYLPFTTGKRIGTGSDTALAEAKVVFAHLLRNFRFSVPLGHVVTPTGGFTLGLRGGLKINWEKIHSSCALSNGEYRQTVGNTLYE